MRRASLPWVSALYEQLSAVQRKVLRILANGGSIDGTAAHRLDLDSKGSAQSARRALLADGHLTVEDGRDRATDPFLADWLRTTYPL